MRLCLLCRCFWQVGSYTAGLACRLKSAHGCLHADGVRMLALHAGNGLHTVGICIPQEGFIQ